MLAIAANQVGFDLFYGARLYLGSVAVVLALLLWGDRGLLVGAASVLLVPRLWAEQQAAMVLLAEVIWLWAVLHFGADAAERRERGDVVLLDVLFWIVVAIPLDLLLFGVAANVDLPTVLDLSLLQAINGSLNAALAYALFSLMRIVQSRGNAAQEGASLHGLMLISQFSLAVLAGILPLAVAVRQLNQHVVDEQLGRYRQTALTASILRDEALDDLSNVRRRQESSLDFKVINANGSILYDSNPALFQTLQAHYEEPHSARSLLPKVEEPLDLLIPLQSEGSAISGLRGYWRYETTDDRPTRLASLLGSARGLMVVVVEPARSGIRELHAQSSEAIRLLGLLVLVAAIAARSISGFIVSQFPDIPVLRGFRADDDRPSSPGAQGLAGDRSNPVRLRSGLRELQPLLQALRSRQDVLVNLQESVRRSERQRHRLEAEVGRLNIIDPVTGCFNRRELHRRLEHEIRLSGRDRRGLSFLCLEIDHLRHIHDSYGTLVCEEVLRLIALELRNRSRVTDFVCRLGPDQFGLLLPACDAESACKVAVLLGDVVRSLEIRHEGSILAVTLSVGLASVQPGRDDPDSLITRAQSALYRAKAEGRDRVVIA